MSLDNKFDQILKNYNDIETKLSSGSLDSKQFAQLSKEFSELNGIKKPIVLDTEIDNWNQLPKFDLIIDCCAEAAVEISKKEVDKVINTNLIGTLNILKKAKKEIPNLIIMDVMMPKMDGIEACEQLRNDTTFYDTIIVFLTARGEDYSYVAAFDAGADDYVTKPFQMEELLAR